MIRGIIYKYTSPSGKHYIGQTTNENQRRKAFNNLNLQYAGLKIDNARRKYSPSNFTYEILEERYYDNFNNCKEDLDRLESYYIGKYDSFNNGYNSTLGGDGNVGYKISDSTKQKLREWNLNRDYGKEIVLQIDLDTGQCIAEFETIRQASKVLGIDSSCISKVCRGKRNKCGGYGWKYKNPDALSNVGKGSGFKPVIQLSLDGEFIAEYESISEANRALGVKESHIGQVCRGQRQISNGYKWKYKQ